MSQPLTIAQFAEAEGCDRKQVYRALKAGKLLAGADGKLDASLVKSGWRKVDKRTLLKAETAKRDTEKESQPIEPVTDYSGALAKKEHYVAKLRQLEYLEKSGSLIDSAAAKSVLFEAARAARDSWLNWPNRVGPLVAAELGIDAADRVTAILTEHVHRHIQALGDPDVRFDRRLH